MVIGAGSVCAEETVRCRCLTSEEIVMMMMIMMRERLRKKDKERDGGGKRNYMRIGINI